MIQLEAIQAQIKNPSFEAAVLAWRRLLGPLGVLVEAQEIEPYKMDLIDGPTAPAAVLRPSSVDEVVSLVKIANQYKVPLYPISKGKNWGYGGACPVEEGNVVVDLGQLNKIHEVNEELAYCVVEPGVTQWDLYQYLERHKISLMADVSGAPPEASLIGNILERGLGHNRYNDHFNTSCAMHVVLANGEIVKTGFAHFGNARAEHVYKEGVGPSLDGLFTQANLGIVVRMTIWLQPKPKSSCAFMFKVEDDDNLAEVVMSLRKLKLQGTISGSIHIGNEGRCLSMLPQSKTASQKYGIKPWNGSGSLSGTKEEVALKRKIVKEALKKYAAVRFIDRRLLAIFERFPTVMKKMTGLNVRELLPLIKMNLDLSEGIPSRLPLRGVYASSIERPKDENLNPLKDGCGMYWHSMVIPAEKKLLREMIELTHSTLSRHGFSSQMTLQYFNERALIGLVSFPFDKHDRSQVQRAKVAFQELKSGAKGGGFLPYRLGIQSMQDFIDADDPFWKTMLAIKRSVDPNNIIALGRYSAGSSRDRNAV